MFRFDFLRFSLFHATLSLFDFRFLSFISRRLLLSIIFRRQRHYYFDFARRHAITIIFADAFAAAA